MPEHTKRQSFFLLSFPQPPSNGRLILMLPEGQSFKITSTRPQALSPEFHSRQSTTVSCKKLLQLNASTVCYICKPVSTEKTARVINPFYIKKTWDVQ